MQHQALNYFTTIELVEICVYILFVATVVIAEFRFRISPIQAMVMMYLCIAPIAAMRVYEFDLLWIVLAATCICLGELHKGKLKMPSVLFLFLFGVVWVLLSYMANQNTTTKDPLAIWRIPKMISYAALVYLIFFNGRSASGVSYEQLVRVFLASLVFLSVIGLCNYIIFLFLGSYPIPNMATVEILGTTLPRVRSLTEDPNFLGQILLLGVSLLLFESRILSSNQRAIYFGVIGVTLCFTFSVTSITLACLLIAIYLYRKLRPPQKHPEYAARNVRHKSLAAAMITGFLIALNLSALYFSHIAIQGGRQTLTSPFWTNKLQSFSNRIAYQSQTLEIINNGRIWFGIGPHQTLRYLRQLVHNSYFQLILEYGIGGLIFVYVVAYMYTMIPRQNTSIRICLIILAFNAYFLEVFYAPSLWLCLLIGLAKNQNKAGKLK